MFSRRSLHRPHHHSHLREYINLSANAHGAAVLIDPLSTVVDITGGRARLIAAVLFELFWSVGLILLPAVAMFSSDWSNLYLVISMPTLGLVFLHRSVSFLGAYDSLDTDRILHRLIPDSPRWMIGHGRLDKARTILTKAARTNNRTVPQDLDAQIETLAR